MLPAYEIVRVISTFGETLELYFGPVDFLESRACVGNTLVGRDG
jgi:hypothetical protein